MSQRRNESFKDSGVEWLGPVPATWKVMPLKYLLRPNGLVRGPFGGDLKKEIFVPKGIKVYEQRNAIYKDCRLGDSFIPETKFKEMTRFKALAGDYLMSCSGTVGRTYRLPESAPLGIINQALLIIRLSNALVSRFADWVFESHFFETQILDNSQGGAMKNLVGMDVFKSIYLPVPPLTEQNAIATFLDQETAKIDALVAEQQRLIALLTEKRQAVISHAVTRGLALDTPLKESGVEWLGLVPAHWEIRKLSSISTNITNGFVGPTRDILVDNGIRYLQSLHIKGNMIKFDTPYYVDEEWSKQHAKSILEVGDVLVVQTGDIGQVAVVPDEFSGCNCHALIIVSPMRSTVLGEWVSWVLNSEYGLHSLLSIQTGALHPHLNCGNVKDLYLPVPPLDEQSTLIASLERQLSSFDELIAEAHWAVSLLQERRTALISAAVTGKIDVSSEQRELVIGKMDTRVMA